MSEEFSAIRKVFLDISGIECYAWKSANVFKDRYGCLTGRLQALQ